MEISILEIAQLIDAEIEGDNRIKISGVRSLAEAGPGDLSFLSKHNHYSDLEKSRASAFIVPPDLSPNGKTFLKVQQPTLALARVLKFLFPDPIPHPRGIHPTAVIGEGVQLGEGVAIGAYAVVGDHCRIGDGTILYDGVHVGAETVIGNFGILYPKVTVREGTQIGKRVILHPGVVIGADGFGYSFTEEGYHKIPQVGRVVIEDDVEIGANSCVDRATLETTVIGRGTKIDNLVQVGHNVQIGKDCILAGQVGISGSVKIGNAVLMGGQVGVKDHVTIGHGVRFGGQAGVAGDISDKGDYLGTPARPMEEFLKEKSWVLRLPELFQELDQIKKKLNSL
ncbi:MAG: UDP-3-O-(3-hydroxymyristoyl)glucosamine N-acyltransferase [bacterium]|nr:UDP-3-O-(3-hydroxymyristoyl)glucosamine N-acyltransferase [bacterium]